MGSLHACVADRTDLPDRKVLFRPHLVLQPLLGRGDGKQGYLAGLQRTFSNVTLRMLPWEEHAKRSMAVLEGGFVCAGPDPRHRWWIADVVSRYLIQI